MSKSGSQALQSSFVGNNPEIKQVRVNVLRLSTNLKPVLIIGERGTGKTMLAQFLHSAGAKSGEIKIFSPLSVQELEIRSLAEGHFADFCTMLVREFEEFSFLHQMLFHNFFNTILKNKTTRLIVTSKFDIRQLIKSGKIREELKGLFDEFETISIPPLSERMEDIPFLVEHFVSQTCEALGKSMKALDSNLLDFLSKKVWRENVQELKSVIEYAVLNSKGDVVELPSAILDEYSQLSGIVKNIMDRKVFAFDDALGNLERILIQRSLEATGYNQTRSAEMLGISGANFRYRLRKFRIRRRPI